MLNGSAPLNNLFKKGLSEINNLFPLKLNKEKHMLNIEIINSQILIIPDIIFKMEREKI